MIAHVVKYFYGRPLSNTVLLQTLCYHFPGTSICAHTLLSPCLHVSMSPCVSPQMGCISNTKRWGCCSTCCQRSCRARAAASTSSFGSSRAWTSGPHASATRRSSTSPTCERRVVKATDKRHVPGAVYRDVVVYVHYCCGCYLEFNGCLSFRVVRVLRSSIGLVGHAGRPGFGNTTVPSR